MAGLGGILGAAGGAIGSLFGGGDDPTLVKPKFSGRSTAAVQGLQETANKTPEQLAAEHMAGAQEAGQGYVASPDAMKQENTALGMASPGDMDSAIGRRASRAYESSMAGMNRQAGITATDKAEQNRRVAQQAVYKRKQMQASVDRAEREYLQADDEARNQVIGQLLGSLGSMVGAGAGMATAPSTPSPAGGNGGGSPGAGMRAPQGPSVE